MGNLATIYGYYDAGESLMVLDPFEAWVFHVLPDSSGLSAIFVAHMIPPNHVASVMNAFTIRAVDLENDKFSPNLRREASLLGWESRTPLDFALLFSGKNEATCKYSSGRRMWSVYNKFAPSLSISPHYPSYLKADYPTSFEPDNKVNSSSFRTMMRDTFDGTEFDLTFTLEQNIPFSSASRWVTPQQTVSNETVCWERSISTFKSIVSFVAEARSWLPDEVGGILYFTPHSARAGLMLPLFSGMKEIASPLTNNSLGAMERGTSAFWGARVLYNLIELKTTYMLADVREFQTVIEDALAQNLTSLVEDEYVDGNIAMSDVQNLLNEFIEEQVRALWDFGDTLLMYYSDGYCSGCGEGSRHLGYPQDWLDTAYKEPIDNNK